MSLPDNIARLRLELSDIAPTIWRRVDVPLAMSLKGVHDVIQAVMLFQDYHLFEFEIDERRYGIVNPGDDDFRAAADARNTKLRTVIDRDVRAFVYTYDFGDDWRHVVTVEEVTQANPGVEYPRFLDGERRAPPEDIGGPPGFEYFLDVMACLPHRETPSTTIIYGATDMEAGKSHSYFNAHA